MYLVKRVNMLYEPRMCAIHENPDRIYTELSFINP